MGQSKPSKTRGKRAIKVTQISSRISSDTNELLKKEFERIQEGSVSILILHFTLAATLSPPKSVQSAF